MTDWGLKAYFLFGKCFSRTENMNKQDAIRQGSGRSASIKSSAAPYIARLHAILVLETFGEV